MEGRAVYEFPKVRDPNIVPEIVGSFIIRTPNKVPLIFGNSRTGFVPSQTRFRTSKSLETLILIIHLKMCWDLHKARQKLQYGSFLV